MSSVFLNSHGRDVALEIPVDFEGPAVHYDPSTSIILIPKDGEPAIHGARDNKCTLGNDYLRSVGGLLIGEDGLLVEPYRDRASIARVVSATPEFGLNTSTLGTANPFDFFDAARVMELDPNIDNAPEIFSTMERLTAVGGSSAVAATIAYTEVMSGFLSELAGQDIEDQDVTVVATVSDAAGSIRLPAALNGLLGFRTGLLLPSIGDDLNIQGTLGVGVMTSSADSLGTEMQYLDDAINGGRTIEAGDAERIKHVAFLPSLTHEGEYRFDNSDIEEAMQLAEDSLGDSVEIIKPTTSPFDERDVELYKALLRSTARAAAHDYEVIKATKRDELIPPHEITHYSFSMANSTRPSREMMRELNAVFNRLQQQLTDWCRRNNVQAVVSPTLQEPWPSETDLLTWSFDEKTQAGLTSQIQAPTFVANRSQPFHIENRNEAVIERTGGLIPELYLPNASRGNALSVPMRRTFGRRPISVQVLMPEFSNDEPGRNTAGDLLQLVVDGPLTNAHFTWRQHLEELAQS